MSDLKISEAGTVQFPMVKHATEIGWTPLSPEVAKQKRGGEAGMLLRDELEAKLTEFNAWLSPDALRSVIETLDAIPATVDGNREMLMWLRGERGWYDEAEKRHRRVQLIDFDHPDANAFHVSWEWTLKPPARKGNRADVMFLINGVPVCIVEHKNPKDGDAIPIVEQVRDVEYLRRADQFRRLHLIAAQLFDAAFDGVAVLRILVFDDAHRHAVDAKHHIRPVALAGGRLQRPFPRDMKGVGIRMVEVDQLDAAMALFGLVIPAALAAQPHQHFAVAVDGRRDRVEGFND